MACYPKRSALAAHPATSVAAAGLEIGILRWRGQARIIVEVEARAWPLRQVTENPWGCGVLPYLLPSTTLIAHERRLSLSHFLDNALHFLDNASHFLEDH